MQSEVGRGTRFTFYLPADTEHVPAIIDTKSEPERGTGRILLMDDEELIHASLGGMLGALGYEVDDAYEGESALRMYQSALSESWKYDAVIMDLTVPGGEGGKESIRNLLRMDPEARVLVASGYANDQIMAKYREYGFSGIIPKPITQKKLADAVKQAMSEPAPEVTHRSPSSK